MKKILLTPMLELSFCLFAILISVEAAAAKVSKEKLAKTTETSNAQVEDLFVYPISKNSIPMQTEASQPTNEGKDRRFLTIQRTFWKLRVSKPFDAITPEGNYFTENESEGKELMLKLCKSIVTMNLDNLNALVFLAFINDDRQAAFEPKRCNSTCEKYEITGEFRCTSQILYQRMERFKTVSNGFKE